MFKVVQHFSSTACKVTDRVTEQQTSTCTDNNKQHFFSVIQTPSALRFMAHRNNIAIILFQKADLIAQHIQDTGQFFALCIKLKIRESQLNLANYTKRASKLQGQTKQLRKGHIKYYVPKQTDEVQFDLLTCPLDFQLQGQPYCIQLQMKTKRQYTIASMMPVKPFPAAPGLLKGCNRP